MELNNVKSINDIAIFLIERNNKLKPLSEKQIKEIEAEFNISLPETYREFLSAMGNGAGKFLLGSSVFFDEIFYLNNWGNELLKENNLDELPEKTFVFWMHHGYQMAFFYLDQGDDPPVYYFSESQLSSGVKLKEENLTNFFIKQLNF